jgi:hypothetical protein
MTHSGYFYPDDVVIEVVDGVRTARVGLELPAIWTERAKDAARRVDFLTGWEMAREEYRKSLHEAFFAQRREIVRFWDAHPEAESFGPNAVDIDHITRWCAENPEVLK